MDIAGKAALAHATALTTRLAFESLLARCLSIAGGTSEITRSVIAERLLGLPRDPLSK